MTQDKPVREINSLTVVIGSGVCMCPNQTQQVRILGLILGLLKEKCTLSSAGFELREYKYTATASVT